MGSPVVVTCFAPKMSISTIEPPIEYSYIYFVSYSADPYISSTVQLTVVFVHMSDHFTTLATNRTLFSIFPLN